MSTRGAVGIIYNGKEKVGYNHFDSYPSGLGVKVLNLVKKNSIQELLKIFDGITVNNESEEDVWDNERGNFSRVLRG